MEQITISQAKATLSKLVERAANGETFAITRYGKPLAVMNAFTLPDVKKRVGFLKSRINVPDDFDTIGKESIVAIFEK